MRAHPLAIALSLALAASALAAPPLVLDLRGGGFTVVEDSDTLRFDRDGVWIDREGVRTLLRRWDELRSVLEWDPSGTLRPLSSERAIEAAADGGAPSTIAEQLAIGDRLWRARTRLERGDLAGSAPLWADLDRALAGERSLRARIAGEGRLRALLLLGGDPVEIVEAALRALQLDRDGWRLPVDAIEALPRDETGWPLAAWPLPVLDESAIERWPQRFGGGSVAEEAALLAAIMRIEPAATIGRATATETLPPAWRTLWEIRTAPAAAAGLAQRERWLQSAGGTATAEARAQTALLHAHLGARLLAEGSDAMRRQALIEWLCVPTAPGVEPALAEWAWSAIEPVARAAALDTLAEYARSQRTQAVSTRDEPVGRLLEWDP